MLLISGQIRINGTVEKVSREESVEYFQSRPRESQISGTASDQSRFITKEELYGRVEKLKEQYNDDETLPCPENWGGYRMTPTSFEFWQGRPTRLHDRFKYSLVNEQWEIGRLSP